MLNHPSVFMFMLSNCYGWSSALDLTNNISSTKFQIKILFLFAFMQKMKTEKNVKIIEKMLCIF